MKELGYVAKSKTRDELESREENMEKKKRKKKKERKPWIIKVYAAHYI